MGARIGEIEEMCAPLLAASEHPDAEGTRAFRETWSRMADKLCALAGEDEVRGGGCRQERNIFGRPTIT